MKSCLDAVERYPIYKQIRMEYNGWLQSQWKETIFLGQGISSGLQCDIWTFGWYVDAIKMSKCLEEVKNSSYKIAYPDLCCSLSTACVQSPRFSIYILESVPSYEF